MYFYKPAEFSILTIEIKSQALSMARPAPCAKLGAVALAESPKMAIFLFLDYQGKDDTSLTLLISVLRIKLAGVI